MTVTSPAQWPEGFCVIPLAQQWPSYYGASPNDNFPGCGKDLEGGLVREQYMFHIVHSPRFPLLVPLKLTFSNGTSHQRFGDSSLP